MYAIGDWVINYENLEIYCEPHARRLTPHAMEVLTHLCRNKDKVVSADELLDAYWPTKYVGNNAVQKAITEIRQALDDDSRNPQYIQTVRGRGYKVIAAVVFDEFSSDSRAGVRREEHDWFPHMSLNRDLVRDALPLSDQNEITICMSMSRDRFPEESRDIYDTLIKAFLRRERIKVIEPSGVDEEVRADITIFFEVIASGEASGKQLSIRVRDNMEQAILFAETFDLGEELQRLEVGLEDTFIPSLIVEMDATARRRMAELGTKSPIAYSKYVQALPYSNAYTYRKEELEHSNRLLREAALLDPGFLMPTVRLAWNMETMLHGRNPADWDYIEAELLNELCRVDKVDPAWWGSDVIRWVLGRFSETGHKDSERILRKIIKARSPFRDSAIAHYGQLLIGAGIHNKGLEFLDLYAKRFPEGQVFDGRAYAEFHLFGPDRAYETLRDLTLQFPQRVAYQAALAALLIKMGRLDEADKVAQRIAELDQYGQMAPLVEARVQIAKGNGDLEQLLRNQGGDFTRGLICFLRNEVDMGCNYWLKQYRPMVLLALSHYQSWHEVSFPETVVQSERYKMMLKSIGLGQPWVDYLRSKAATL